MVICDLPKVETWVRFPSPAQKYYAIIKTMRKSKPKMNRFIKLVIWAILVSSLAIVAYLFWNYYTSSIKAIHVPLVAPEQKIEISLPFTGVYNDKQKRFTITPPANWLMKEKNIGNATVQFLNSITDQDVTGKFSANINVLIESTSLTLADYIAASETTLRKVLPNYKLIDSKKMKFGALSGHILGGTFTNGGVAFHNRQIFIISKGNVYIVTAISLASLWDKYVPDFKDSLYGFRVL